MLMTEWYLVYSDYDGPTYRVVRPLPNARSWVDQNGIHTAAYKDDQVMPISDPTEWKSACNDIVLSDMVMDWPYSPQQKIEPVSQRVEAADIEDPSAPRNIDGMPKRLGIKGKVVSGKTAGVGYKKQVTPKPVGARDVYRVPYNTTIPKGYTRFHAYDRDGWYIGPIDASYARSALEGAHDVYKGLSVWFVSSAPIKAIRP